MENKNKTKFTKLSIIIPCYNEENTLKKVVEILNKVKINLPKKEIIIVDDGSSDKSLAIAKQLEKLYPAVKSFAHERNQGKGAALKTGFSKCSGDIVIIQDADLEYDPHEYNVLLGPILEHKADIVYGSRFLTGLPHRVLFFWHSIGNKLLTLLSNVFSDLNLTDMETCYKMFTREVITQIDLKEKRFGVEPELTAKLATLAREKGYRIFEVGISYDGRTYDEGKKIGFKDALSAVRCILRYNNTVIAKTTRLGLRLFFYLIVLGVFGYLYSLTKK